MAQILEVLIPVANAVVRPTRQRRAENHYDLIIARRIGDRELNGQIMRPTPRVVLVHQRHHNWCVGTAARVGESKVGLRPHGLTVEIPKAQRMNEAGGVLNLSVQADHGCFAVGLNRLPAAGQCDHPLGHHFTQHRAIRLDLWLEVFHKTPRPGVPHNRRHRKHAPRLRRRTKPFDQGFFVVGDNFANLRLHQRSPSKLTPVSTRPLPGTNE